MIRIKAGVTPKNLVIAAAAANVAQIQGLTVVITSGTDGKHMTGSRHYTGEALDFRTSNLKSAQLQDFIEALRVRLGAGYQIIRESDHLHVEVQPPAPATST